MSAPAWRQPPLTKEQEFDFFMIMLEDDTEDAPWMVMGDLQFWSASSFAHSLRIHAHEQGLPWYVASMLPILYRWPRVKRKKQLAPDVFVAFAPEHSRSSYDLTKGEPFPAFVLEVVSPSSAGRDEEEKLLAYAALGAQEYLLFTPRNRGESSLVGYRRGAPGELLPWPVDGDGNLWSDVLGLWLTVDGNYLQAKSKDGRILLSPEQEAAARWGAEAARREAEAETARLRLEIERLKRGEGS
jgi:Putative restriction endonuclease